MPLLFYFIFLTSLQKNVNHVLLYYERPKRFFYSSTGGGCTILYIKYIIRNFTIIVNRNNQGVVRSSGIFGYSMV